MEELQMDKVLRERQCCDGDRVVIVGSLKRSFRSWSRILAQSSYELHHTSHPRNADVFSCSFLRVSLVFYTGSRVACYHAAA